MGERREIRGWCERAHGCERCESSCGPVVTVTGLSLDLYAFPYDHVRRVHLRAGRMDNIDSISANE